MKHSLRATGAYLVMVMAMMASILAATPESAIAQEDEPDTSVHLPCARSGPNAAGPKAAQICWIDWSNAPQIPMSESSNTYPVTIDVENREGEITTRIAMLAYMFSYEGCWTNIFGNYVGRAYPQRPLAQAYDTGNRNIALTDTFYADPENSYQCTDGISHVSLSYLGGDEPWETADSSVSFRFVYGDAGTHATLENPSSDLDGGIGCLDRDSTFDECTTVRIDSWGEDGMLSQLALVGDPNPEHSYSGGVLWNDPRYDTHLLSVAGGNGDPNAEPNEEDLVESRGALVALGSEQDRENWEGYEITLDWNTLFVNDIDWDAGTMVTRRIGAMGAAVGMLFDEASLNYDANAPANAAASGTTDGAEGVDGDRVLIAANGFAVDGYEFTGWNTAQDGSGTKYMPGDEYTLSGNDAVLFAQWKRSMTPEPTPTATPEPTPTATPTATPTPLAQTGTGGMLAVGVCALALLTAGCVMTFTKRQFG